jgi:hypothetical protein
MSWFSLIVTISVVLFVAPRTAKALDCAPLNPHEQVGERARSDIEGSAATLFRIGKFQGSYKSETEREVKNLYDKYPNADKLVIRSKLIYFFCTYLDSAKDLNSEAKFQKFMIFSAQVMDVGIQQPQPSTQEQPIKPPPPPPHVINIDGSWRDSNNPRNGSRITQEGNSFQFNGWGALPQGIPFESTGNGTVTGEDIKSTYTTRYLNGWIAQGNCSGTVSRDGSRMTSTCTDNVLGTFVISGVRQ